MKNFFSKTFLIILLMSAISSCVSIPSEQQMQLQTADYNLPQTNHSENVLVYMIRPSRLGAMIKFNVFIDDKNDSSEVGYNTGKRYIYFFVKSGSHKILSKAENWAEIGINGQPGETIFIRQDVALGFLLPRNNLEIISEAEAKYHIHKIKKGVILKEVIE